MSGATKSIIFHDGRKPIHHIEPGMVEPILNMTYMQQLLISDDVLCIGGRRDDEEYDVTIIREDGSYKVASVVDDADVIETIKEIKTLGNSLAVSLSMECKMLGIAPGDKIRIRIERAGECNETR